MYVYICIYTFISIYTYIMCMYMYIYVYIDMYIHRKLLYIDMYIHRKLLIWGQEVELSHIFPWPTRSFIIVRQGDGGSIPGVPRFSLKSLSNLVIF